MVGFFLSDYLTVDGDLTLKTGFAIDLGLDAAVDGPAYDAAFPIAVVTGKATVPSRARARNAGRLVRGFELTVLDGVVWATPSPGGTVLFIR